MRHGTLRIAVALGVAVFACAPAITVASESENVDLVEVGLYVEDGVGLPIETAPFASTSEINSFLAGNNMDLSSIPSSEVPSMSSVNALYNSHIYAHPDADYQRAYLYRISDGALVGSYSPSAASSGTQVNFGLLPGGDYAAVLVGERAVAIGRFTVMTPAQVTPSPTPTSPPSSNPTSHNQVPSNSPTPAPVVHPTVDAPLTTEPTATPSPRTAKERSVEPSQRTVLAPSAPAGLPSTPLTTAPAPESEAESHMQVYTDDGEARLPPSTIDTSVREDINNEAPTLLVGGAVVVVLASAGIATTMYRWRL